MPWNDARNIRSHPLITLMTTSTIAVQSMTATSDTHAMRRLRRYFQMRRDLYKLLPSEREQTAEAPIDHLGKRRFSLQTIVRASLQKFIVQSDEDVPVLRMNVNGNVGL